MFLISHYSAAANFAFGTIVLKFSSQEELENKINDMEKYIKVLLE